MYISRMYVCIRMYVDVYVCVCVCRMLLNVFMRFIIYLCMNIRSIDASATIVLLQ